MMVRELIGWFALIGVAWILPGMPRRWWAMMASLEFALYLYLRDPGHYRSGDVGLWFTFWAVAMMLTTEE